MDWDGEGGDFSRLVCGEEEVRVGCFGEGFGAGDDVPGFDLDVDCERVEAEITAPELDFGFLVDVDARVFVFGGFVNFACYAAGYRSHFPFYGVVGVFGA